MIIYYIGKSSVDQAAAETAAALAGPRTAKHVAVVRADYYDCENRPAVQVALDFFSDSFLRWRDQVLTSDDEMRKSNLRHYANHFGPRRKELLDKLFRDLRSDPVQHTRNGDWVSLPAKTLRDRIDSRCWNLPSEMYFLAGRLVELARFYAGIGEVCEARPLYERALHLWQTHGSHCSPHQMPDAITQLQAEMEWASSYSVNPLNRLKFRSRF